MGEKGGHSGEGVLVTCHCYSPPWCTRIPRCKSERGRGERGMKLMIVQEYDNRG